MNAAEHNVSSLFLHYTDRLLLSDSQQHLHIKSLRMPGRPATQVVREVEAVDCLDFSGKTHYGDFRDDLVKDGFAVIKGAIPPERAAQYASDFHQYMEDL